MAKTLKTTEWDTDAYTHTNTHAHTHMHTHNTHTHIHDTHKRDSRAILVTSARDAIQFLSPRLHIALHTGVYI